MEKPLNGLSVLVVDDFEVMRLVLNKILTASGVAEVVEADCGDSAFKALEQKTFDVVLLDWQLTDTTGLEILQQMKQDEKLKDIPVIMLTAHTNAQDHVTAEKAGAAGYLEKPATKEDIVRSILGVITPT